MIWRELSWFLSLGKGTDRGWAGSAVEEGFTPMPWVLKGCAQSRCLSLQV